MTIEIFHSLALILTIAASFLLTHSSFADYSLQVIALLFIFYSIYKKFFNKDGNNIRILDGILFTFILITIINNSGGLSSPLFFLNYFLLFALALLLEPIISITTTLAIIVFYLLSIPENQTLEQLLPLFALPFLTPFALFLGEELRKNSKLKTQISNQSQNQGLFISLNLKEQLKNIQEAAENFVGERELTRIKISTRKAEKLIEEYEDQSS